MGSKVTNTFLVLFLLFSQQSAFANSVSDSTTIKLRVVVTEAMLPQKCTFGFDSDPISLSHTTRSDCSFNSSKLTQKAGQLASPKMTQKNGSAFVMITVTAP